MPVDPQVEAFLAEFSKYPPLHELPLEVARSMALPSAPPVPLASIEDRVVPAPEGHQIPIRIYRPRLDARLPAVIYYHGGGWVIGSLDSYDGLCRRIASQGECVVISVDYRLAPEFKFPAAPDDALTAFQWVAAQAAALDIDGSRLVVAGDSAGGNLAAVTCVQLRDEGGPQPLAQLLIYPVVRHHLPAVGSLAENGQGYLLDQAAMAWFLGHYLAKDSDQTHPHYAVALTPNLAGLPPALVITAEFDPLRDQGEEFAQRLRGEGNRAETWRFDGMIHGFYGMAGIDRGSEAVDRSAAWLRSVFAASTATNSTA
jgi:acetyl esterase